MPSGTGYTSSAVNSKKIGPAEYVRQLELIVAANNWAAMRTYFEFVI